MRRRSFIFSLVVTGAIAAGGWLGPSARGEEKTPKVSVRNVDPAGAEKILAAKKEIVVLDVRTPKEFAAGRIAGARNVDFYAPDFEKKVGDLDKGKEYLVYCAAGGRSSKTVDKLKKQGFQSIYHLDGGFTAWEKAGKSVEK